MTKPSRLISLTMILTEPRFVVTSCHGTFVPLSSTSTLRVRYAMMTFGARAAPQTAAGGIMRTKVQRLALLGVLVGGLLVALSAPTSAATNQISGVSFYDTTGECGLPPAGYEDFTSYPTSRDDGGSGRLLVHEGR